MKTDSSACEILLLTASSFSKRQLYEIDATRRYQFLAPAEQLESACWNGLLPEMLPEVLHEISASEKIYLWNVETKNACLRLSMAAWPPVLENYYTLDPQIFLCDTIMN